MADPSTRVFRASLRGRLYRDIELPSSGSLEDLAAAIVSAFGFDFDHAFGFYSNLKGDYYRSEERYELFADLGEEAGEGARSVRRTRLGTAFPEVGKSPRRRGRPPPAGCCRPRAGRRSRSPTAGRSWSGPGRGRGRAAWRRRRRSGSRP